MDSLEEYKNCVNNLYVILVLHVVKYFNKFFCQKLKNCNELSIYLALKNSV